MRVVDLLRKGAEHVAAQRYVEAEKCFRAAYDKEPKNLDAVNGLGISLHELGRLTDAVHFLKIAVQLAPDFPISRINLGLVYLERNDLDDALACFNVVLQVKPTHPEILAQALAWLATCLERKNVLEGVEEYFESAAELSSAFRAGKMLRFSRNFLHEIEAIVSPELQTIEILKSQYEGHVTLVALVSADPKYIRKYGRAMINSFAMFNDAAILLHLHIIDPDRTIATEVRAMIDRAGIRSYRITSEVFDFFAPGTLAKSVWYTCSRLWHLDEWVREYNAPVIALDIDASIQMPLQKVVDTLSMDDLGLYFRQPRRAPWMDIQACVVVARPTKPTQAFLRLLRNYITYFILRGQPKWHLDQCALYCTLRMIQRFGKAPSVHSIAEIGAEATFQVGHSYDDRMNDPRHARFSG